MEKALDATGEPVEPIRTCIGCRGRDGKSRLVRVVADVAGRIRIDGPGTAPGRGAYVHPARRCVEQLLKRDALGRALKRAVVSPKDGDAFLAGLARVTTIEQVGTGGDGRRGRHEMKGSEVSRA